MKDFRSLTVWQKGMTLVKLVYVLSKKLPDEEKFGLTNQIRRCAISIPSNIAEGSKRNTDKDFKQFLRIASGSAAELETQLLLIFDLYGVRDPVVDDVLKEIQKMLEVFIKKL